jgi:membrane protein implicated in regulation of membrane protease activity
MNVMDTLFLIYLVCFGVGLLFTLLSALLAHVFGGHDVHMDVAVEAHAEAGFSSHDMPGFAPVSPTTIAAFVTAFGGFGMIFSRISATSSVWISAPLAVAGGFSIALLIFLLFRQIFRYTQSSSEAHVADLIGEPAIVITPIPQNGVGEIAYVQGGTRYSAPAREENGTAVLNGQTVRIMRIAGNQFYVIPMLPF